MKLAFDEGLIGLDEAGIDDILLEAQAGSSTGWQVGNWAVRNRRWTKRGSFPVSHDQGAPLVDEKRQSPITFETPRT